MRVHFIDTETTGLTPGLHLPWEVARIIFDVDAWEVVDANVWQLPLTDVELLRAEPIALEINRFAERRHADLELVTDEQQFITEFWGAFEPGDHWAGACPWFDVNMILARVAPWFDQGMIFPPDTPDSDDPPSVIPTPWHYHLIDVENMMMGYLAGLHFASPSDYRDLRLPLPPWKHGDIIEAVGAPTMDESDKHSAMGDVVSALNVWKFMTLEAGK